MKGAPHSFRGVAESVRRLRWTQQLQLEYASDGGGRIAVEIKLVWIIHEDRDENEAGTLKCL